MMQYLNLAIEFLRGPKYIGSAPVERATWLSVLGYCVDQETGGRLVGAASWKDRQWQQACGVTAEEVRGASKLITIDGADVIVAAYPIKQEQKAQHNRNVGSKGGRASQRKNAARAAAEKAGGDAPVPPEAKERERHIANMPAPLEAHAGFVKAWREWEEHFDSVNTRAMSARATSVAWEEASRLGPEAAAACIRYSIGCNAPRIYWDAKIGAEVKAAQKTNGTHPDEALFQKWLREFHPNNKGDITLGNCPASARREFTEYKKTL